LVKGPPPPKIYFLPYNSYFGYRFEERQINKIGVSGGGGGGERDVCVY
jgi:hypothetical protein